ncbi:predicted protein [Phaeodactylum tricornutum CCAP 1055/1]|jgi:hypothetical protein|uniref:Uncharacterized protein n=2 Tax=Phaeodactylum tricornutum TaxID=2850 RepID=B7G5C1_PHATC|nr:predicted protein [Phaeodactylum tricornutum CCAP 1055/1]EEC46289.1 predicted protein [Phaeodactylum tricornutum CCAP 1055/1]|eukprot:XP_002182388.1 predicted protein [Phaeodactylum tricornutum CCAP 1055/1]
MATVAPTDRSSLSTKEHSVHFSSFRYEAELPSTRKNEQRPSYKIQVFRVEDYDNVTHDWKCGKIFQQTKIRAILGIVREELMDQAYKTHRRRLSGQDETWDPEGLVLSTIDRPFTSKMLFSVADATSIDPKSTAILRGMWFSKVYRGDYEREFKKWTKDALEYVRSNFSKVASTTKDFYVFYPSTLEKEKCDQLPVVVFFMKISD